MTHGMVSAAQPEAVEAGLEAFKAGGNAVDAAVATALVQTAVDPQMCGIAGFGSLHVYDPKRRVHAFLDFHGRAPLSVTPTMWEHLLEGESEDGFGFILKGRINEIGYGAISTPMTLRGLNEALTRYGTMSLKDLIQPAIGYCEEGFMVRPHVAAYWNQVPTEGRAPHSDFLTKLPATRKIYAKPDGKLRAVGEILKNPDLGRTYRAIATDGVEDFYSGKIASRIVEDMAANGGLITLDDLKGAKPETNEPLWGTYRPEARHQPAARRWRDAGRDAEHSGEFRSEGDGPQLARLHRDRRRSDEDRDRGQGHEGRRSAVCRRATG